MMDRIELYHLGLDYLEKYAENIKRVTEADVLKAAQDHLFPDNYLLVVIGNLTQQSLDLPNIEWQ